MQRKDGPSLVGRTVQVGDRHMLVEALVGEGGFGQTYRARDAASGALFALKHMRIAAASDALREIRHEASIMERLNRGGGHPCVLRLHATLFAGGLGSETDGFMLLDYCSGAAPPPPPGRGLGC